MKKMTLQSAKPGSSLQHISPRRISYYRGHIESSEYVFGDCDDDSDGENHSLKDLKQEQYMEKEIQPGDSLQAISLQFNCPIAELKRINNIHRDNEIFARRTIKVPMKVFTKNLIDVQTPPQPDIATEPSNSVNDTILPTLVSPATSSDRDVAELEDGPDEVEPLLVTSEPDKSTLYSCNGADWGISWLQLLICSLLLGFAGPILYVLYVTEDAKSKH